MAELIEPRALREMLLAGRPLTLIDVRGAEAYAAGHLPGALHIPADDLPRRLGEVPRDRPVVAY
jgi:rhodanese-related sulfurtransferase